MARPGYEDLRIEIIRHSLWSVLLYQALADRLGLSLKDALGGAALALDGPRTPGGLARLLSVTTGGAVTGVADRLEEAGLARRTRDPDDGRRVILEPVPETLAVLLAHLDRAAVLAARTDDLSDDELSFLVGWLQEQNAAATHDLTG
ncbi:MarR family winged helix-turn-helix transcriptional regulator [Actinomadura sp. 3N407]|uniref:MarR family winged helix-turn-helix transcriptional regulator n=1 Tax=Actinomadura sp. 3N407 TaxID=3457423 RepID=UPI003FCEACA3